MDSRGSRPRVHRTTSLPRLVRNSRGHHPLRPLSGAPALAQADTSDRPQRRQPARHRSCRPASGAVRDDRPRPRSRSKRRLRRVIPSQEAAPVWGAGPDPVDRASWPDDSRAWRVFRELLRPRPGRDGIPSCRLRSRSLGRSAPHGRGPRGRTLSRTLREAFGPGRRARGQQSPIPPRARPLPRPRERS